MEEWINGLDNFTGTSQYYHYPIGNFLYTDGIDFLVESGKCYWLLDVIGSYLLYRHIRAIPFQLWELTVHDDHSAVVTMKEDSDEPVIVKQKIPYTDFPMDYIKLYLIINGDAVLLLPSEY